MQRKTITLTEQMENWVKAQIDSRKYGNDSKYFRDLIRRIKNDEKPKLDSSRCLMRQNRAG